MRFSHLSVVACCLTLTCTLALKAQHAGPVASIEAASVQHGPDCDGEPCDAVIRGARSSIAVCVT
jgi:hypothetical protein